MSKYGVFVSELDLIVNSFHHSNCSFIFKHVSNHLNTNRQSNWTFHITLENLCQRVINSIFIILILSFVHSGNWNNTCWIFHHIPNVSILHYACHFACILRQKSSTVHYWRKKNFYPRISPFFLKLLSEFEQSYLELIKFLFR